jgi:hypothetical protein
MYLGLGLRLGSGTFGKTTSPLLTDLVAYWNLDTASWLDTSGNGYTLTNNNGVTNAAGIINNGALFNGEQYLKTTSFPTITGNFCISCWVKSTNTQAQQTFIESPTENALNVYFINGGLSVDDYLNVSDIFEVGSFDNNTWYNIVIVKDNGVVSAYSNGTFLASTEQDINITNGIGIGGSSYLSDYWTLGVVDEVGVWNRALTGAEITSLYNAGAGTTYPFA